MKKNKKNRKSKCQVPTNKNSDSTPVKVENEQELSNNLEMKIGEICNKNAITPLNISQVNIPEVETKVNFKSVQELYHKVLAIHKILVKRKKECEQLNEKLENDKISLDEEKAENQKLKNEYKERVGKYNKELTEINQLRVDGSWSSVIDKKLLDHNDELLKNQENILLEKIAELNEKHAEYISSLAEIETKKLKIEESFQEKYIKEEEKLHVLYQQKFKSKEEELKVLSDKLENKQKELKKEQREIDYAIEDFKDNKEFLTEKAKSKVLQNIQELKQNIQDYKDKNIFLKDESDRLHKELNYLGNDKAKDIVGKLRKTETELYELKEKLQTSPNLLKIDELKRLRVEKNDWQNQLREAEASLNYYKTRYENQKLQVGEKETLEYQKEQLEQRIKLQKTAFDELKGEVDDLTLKSENKTTFASCSEMDKKYELPCNNLAQNKIDKGWLRNVQQAIAQVTDNKLYYDENTIRSFISGLAMSRFSILQGISGTGKTSLPKALAKAIGGNSSIVEVQSGWTDRQDLIGYYNTFEKKYYEGKFLKLLYMAGTPKYRDKPFFIILDEMNLSHPEYYFADMLSLMEETDCEKQVLTISDKVKDIPKLMLNLEEGGIGLKVPDNVWFIGTANHDETTLQFAPKTYDRANVLEMPININKFKLQKLNFSKISTPNKVLLDFFNAQKWDDNNNVFNYLDGEFGSICKKLGIGWGNRLKKHIKLFTPVFEALDGNIANALDHIIASKILRPIKGQYELQETVLNEMKDELEIHFKQEFGEVAKKSLKIVMNELSRIE